MVRRRSGIRKSKYKPTPSQADLEALRVAGERMQELIAAAGTSEEEIIADFKVIRRGRHKRKN